MYFDQRTGAPHAVCWSKSILAYKKELTRLTNNIARQNCFRQALEVILAKNNTIR